MTMTIGPKRKMEVYAVTNGFSPAPGVFSSWGHVHPLVTGFPKAKHRKFTTVLEAEAHMKDQRLEEYIKIIEEVPEDMAVKQGEKVYYAVANGRSPGIREFYSGDGGTEPKVMKFSGACHKRFPSLMQAEKFIADWVEMYSSVCKELIKQEFSRGFRPLSINGPPIRFIREPERIIVKGSVECMLSEMRI
ncbi:Uncharacterized protein BP5553_05089 [Venustampulla echinocandica]|uniref:Ribonuclease H1 N-terminal domain-containing protein n=1 Tax=Venustampulla echinocandica TaxID=2656787 RepID=A0A370TQ63_9HELO|nr:Uncharacterized protein BP5553_05089 [Venustampulla echinocandica]RDL37656.1 Uncharacterized protein BP5553_05089 [Venustampulla echinocandica]